MRSLGLSLSLCLLPALATVQTTPKAGSAERKAIMDALRLPIEKALKKKVVFRVDHLKTHRGWAFLYGVPLQPNGKKFDYRGTPYAQAQKDGMFDENFCGLLKKEGAKWKVKSWRVGMTDVAWIGWDKQFGAPVSIFPTFGR